MTTVTDRDEMERRIRAVPRPEPVLSRERANQLTPRQRELLDQITDLIRDGFSHLTMADLAARLNCSLRTLYGLARSREELVLMAIDRNLWSVGRRSRSAGTAGADPLASIRAYLAAANVAVSEATPAFARDLMAMPEGAALQRAHNQYLMAVTRELLDYAVERNDIDPVDTTAVAHVVAGLGTTFAQPDVIETIDHSPRDAANQLVDIILRGLQAPHP
ncbi:MAG: TetR/AcrR family transcriptional regulator [Acidimicrobiales bacterium]